MNSAMTGLIMTEVAKLVEKHHADYEQVMVTLHYAAMDPDDSVLKLLLAEMNIPFLKDLLHMLVRGPHYNVADYLGSENDANYPLENEGDVSTNG